MYKVIIQFNKKACLKPHIDMNTRLRIETKNDFEKDFFKLMNNAVFGKTMKNIIIIRTLFTVGFDQVK